MATNGVVTTPKMVLYGIYNSAPTGVFSAGADYTANGWRTEIGGTQRGKYTETEIFNLIIHKAQALSILNKPKISTCEKLKWKFKKYNFFKSLLLEF